MAATVNLTSNSALTFASPVLNPVTQTTSTSVPVSSNQSFTFEAGYDINGGLVVNIYPINPSNSPTSAVSAVSCIRYAGGQMTVFDQSGDPIPAVMPNANMAIPNPLTFLGSNPGASVIAGIVVPQSTRTFPALSTLPNGTVSYSQNNLQANIVGTTQSGVSTQWSYSLSGANWIAQSVSLTSSVANSTSTRVYNFSNVAWNDNTASDAARASAAPTVVPPPPATVNVPSSMAVPPPVAQYTPNFATITPPNCNSNTYSLGGPQNVVMQHGLFSSSCAWTRMANWLNQDFRFGTELIPSITGNNPLATQTQQLIGQLQATTGSGYILMGHSQGGLISRSAAQYFQTNAPVSLSGVITIDSPNNGADFAANGYLALTFLAAWGATSFANQGCFTGLETPGCFDALLEVLGGAGGLTALSTITQSIPDLVSFSPFLSQLNGYSETFNRAAVIGYTPQRWAFTRVVSEIVDGIATTQPGPEPCNPEDSCGERAIAADTEYFYDAVEIAIIVDIIVSFFDPGAAALLPYLFEILIDLDAADGVWNLFMDHPGDGSSDGIVDGPGQLYLGANAGAVQYPIYGADSHSAALRSTYDHSTLDTILANQFHVPTQASCTFTTSPASLTLSALAISSSLTLATGSGCQWSATSNTSWLSITSGINGLSAGPISYAAQANPSTVPRQGSFQVGNGFSSDTVDVFQAGICTYTFSPGPEIASPPSGETLSIKVNTQINCPWTVSTNNAWLTLSAGTTGLGSGSFNLSAAPDSLNADRVGTVTLLGQTRGAILTVIDGSPVGTPGVGSVTIDGFGRTATYNPCAGTEHSCPVTVTEGGTVAINVGSNTYSTTVGGPSQNAPIASTLAALMNQPYSPIIATVSGSTINIRSSVNGADTNYPLSTSFTFIAACGTNPQIPSQCLFSSPAYYAVASGPTLTGGTN